MSNATLISTLGILVFVFPTLTNATLVTQNTSDANLSPQSSAVPAGQSVTTPSGTSWDNLTFNWYGSAGTSTPLAFGTLYLLSQEYLGSPSALSSGTPGFIASASANGAGTQYGFGATVTLSPSSQYWFYTDNPGGTAWLNFSDEYSGGNAYQRVLSGNYASQTSRDFKFQLNGTAVPEPSSFLLLGLLGSIVWCILAIRSFIPTF